MSRKRDPKIIKKVAKFASYKSKLFDLYTRCRYNELIANSLTARAAKIEKFVRWSVFVTLAISLITGSTTYLNPPALAPLWAVITALATLLSIYSLIVGSSSKQFSWFDLARKFHTLAEEVEFFSEYVKLGKITEKELLARWRSFSQKLADLVEQGGVELKEFAHDNEKSLREKLSAVLRQENRD